MIVDVGVQLTTDIRYIYIIDIYTHIHKYIYILTYVYIYMLIYGDKLDQ